MAFENCSVGELGMRTYWLEPLNLNARPTLPFVKPGEPMKSKLYTSLLPNAEIPMPPDGKTAPPQKDITLIHDWIASGAKPRRTIRRRRMRCRGRTGMPLDS